MATDRRSADYSPEERMHAGSYRLGQSHARSSTRARAVRNAEQRQKISSSRAKTARKAEKRKQQERIDKNRRAAQSRAQREKERITRSYTESGKTRQRREAARSRERTAKAANETARRRIEESEKLRVQRAGAQRQRASENARRQSLQEARFLQGQENERARQARRRSAAPVSSPSTTVGSGQGSGATPFSLDRTATSKAILLIIVICTIASAVHDVKNQSPDITQLNVSGQTVRVPQHLRSVGAVLIMGTVALVVNEIDAGIGMVLGLGILFLNVNSILGMFASLTSFFTPKNPAVSGATAPVSGVNSKNQPVYGSPKRPSASI